MGIYSNTASFSQYRIIGEIPDKERFEWFAAALCSRIFNNIEQSTEESSEGWTCTDRPDAPAFTTAADFWRDNYLVFSYRQDQRRIPGALFKFHINRAEAEEFARRPELKRLSKQKKEEITERTKLGLLAKTLPAPTTVDLVWQYDAGLLILFSTSAKVRERFEDLFAKSFENLRAQLIYPYARAIDLLDDGQKEKFASLNQADTDAALAEIQYNTWLGAEFMLWLLHSGVNGGSFQVLAKGHFDHGESFAAWIDDKIQLQGATASGPQKVVVSGSQDSYMEAKSALKSGKSISNATLYIEKDEMQWRFGLDGELFTFSSFKAPPVQIEKDVMDGMTEKEAVFYERVYLLETGLQLFDSLLLTFLTERLSEKWSERLQEIESWLKE